MSATYRALRIDPDGSMRVVNVPRRDALPLLQHHVGGFIQLVPISSNTYLYCNEEGLLLDLARNDTATVLVSAYLPPDEFIVGSVLLITEGADGERDLDDDDLERLELDYVEWCERCCGRGWVPVPADCVSDGDSDDCPECVGTGLFDPHPAAVTS